MIELITKNGKILIKTSSGKKNIKAVISSKEVILSSSQMKQLFNPGTATQFSDLRINLHSIKFLIDKNKGLLQVSSEKKTGTQFKISLPLKIGSLEKLHKKKIKKKIVVIDDNPIVGELLKDILRDTFYSVDCAQDGIRGIEKLKNNKYDIAFVDYIMPNLNGLEVARFINRKKLKTKIIFCTGVDVDFKNELIDDLNISFILKKPFNASDFERTIKNMLAAIEENRNNH